MVKKCVVCGASQERGSFYSFHRFPSDINRCIVWKKALNIGNEKIISQNHVVCSQHFRKKDFEYFQEYTTKGRLKEAAIPNLCENRNTIQVIDKLPENIYKNTTTNDSMTKIHKDSITNISMIEASKENTAPKIGYPTSTFPRYSGDLTEEHFSTPRKRKKNLEFIKDIIEIQRKKVRLLTVENTRLHLQIDNFTNLLQNLSKHQLISEDGETFLKASIPQQIQVLLDRKLSSSKSTFSPELRTFALSLHFYSPRGYNYVRKYFENLLPHPKTLNKWYRVINGEPGFTNEAFDAIEKKSSESIILINLVMDEMAIRQKVDYCGERFYGFIETGTSAELHQTADDSILASSALVVLAVALNQRWKIPLGYFLIKSLNGEQRANILKTALELLHQSGAVCMSITFDGAAVNLSMCKNLGANYDLHSEHFQPWILHPVTAEKVYTFWDACHMLKLCRGIFGDIRNLKDLNNYELKWEYIEQLVEIQEAEGLRSANQLTKRHINFHNEVMNVKLAAQTLSSSVACLLCHLKTICSEFKNTKNIDATANYCLVMNNIFDILNSKSKFATSKLNKPVSDENFGDLKETVKTYVHYLKMLRDNDNNYIVDTRRKTGLVGFIIDLTNILLLYCDLKRKGLNYFLTFKLSQDHIETFFGAIRGKGGFNNNPSALHFKSAYKKLLLKNQITGSKNGNCSILDSLEILNVSSDVRSRTSDVITEDELIEFDLEMAKKEGINYINDMSLSSFVSDVVSYIAGYVVHKIKKQLVCGICSSQLISHVSPSTLTNFKNLGKLTFPSQSVVKLCRETEKYITGVRTGMFKEHCKETITLKVIKNVQVFDNSIMNSHVKNQDFLDNHRIQLMKLIIKTYLTVRIHPEIKKLSTVNTRVRHKFTKLVLFHNQ